MMTEEITNVLPMDVLCGYGILCTQCGRDLWSYIDVAALYKMADEKGWKVRVNGIDRKVLCSECWNMAAEPEQLPYSPAKPLKPEEVDLSRWDEYPDDTLFEQEVGWILGPCTKNDKVKDYIWRVQNGGEIKC